MTARQFDVLATVGIAVCWSAFALTWLGGAIYYQSRSPRERTRSWLGSTTAIGAVILLAVNLAVPRAGWQSLVFYATWARVLGLVVLLGGTVFTLWARLVLGAMWSAAPAVKEQHSLRTSGPYAITRHPIYTGILAMMLGTLLAAGGGRCALPFPVCWALFEIKIHVEERLMMAEFPDDYPRYRRQVPQLVPGAILHR